MDVASVALLLNTHDTHSHSHSHSHSQATMTSIISSVLSFLSLNNIDRPGSAAKNRMRIVAAPGLMTLLDVAFFRTVEGQLTGTLTTSHALLEAWLALQRQAVLLLQELAATTSGANDYSNSNHFVYSSLNNNEQKRILQMESLARACFEAACDAIHLINTDRLASLGNLSDPYYSTATTSQQQQQARSGSGLLFLSSNSSPEELTDALQESVLDTGRRRYPLHQRRKDCWESPRLYCPDHVWADEVWQAGQHVLRQLQKHPYSSALHKKHLTSVEASLSGSLPLTSLTSSPSSSSPRGNKSSATNTKAQTTYIPDKNDSLLEEQMHLLWLILSKDLPTRLIQFKAAMEAEAAVSKRLYLVKCEYRAPFRAFLESHHAVQRAPSLALVDEYLTLTGNSRNNKTVEQRRDTLKDRFQKLLQTPQLVEALALEQRCEEYESAMAAALFPFCELARYLDQKRARLRRENTSRHHHLTERLRRFKGLLFYRSSSSSSSSSGSVDVASSSGIRPLLLDLQGVPTDEEAKAAVLGIENKRRVTAAATFTPTAAPAVSDLDDSTSSSTTPPVLDMEIALERVDQLLADLRALGTLCETRNAFLVESGKKSDTFDLPASIIRGCTDDLDAELFRCHFQDWCAMVVRQHELTNNEEFERLAEKLRRAEMQMGLASASNKSLQVIRQRLETLSTDREKRFEVLKAMLEEVCLREMDLHVTVEAPGRDKILSLPKTSALGVFGRALQLAGEPLPIG